MRMPGRSPPSREAPRRPVYRTDPDHPDFGPIRIVYPERDGNPVGETDAHIAAIFYLRMALRWIARDLEQVYVAANMMFYYEEGEPTSRLAPDVFVVRGVPTEDRRTFKLWEEDAPPALIVEVTSKSSRIEDQGKKKVIYEMLGVREYLLFDPLGDYLDPAFQAFRLEGDGYRRVELGPEGGFRSAEIPVEFRPDGKLLRVIDLGSGEVVPLPEEATDLAREARVRAEREARRAEEEARRAEEAARRTEEATRRLRDLEEENRRLQALLEESSEG